MSPLFSRSRLAALFGVSRSRITAMEHSGILPEPLEDESTDRAGWTSGTAFHVNANRQGRQASPTFAALPETTTPLPVVNRQIVHYHHQVETFLSDPSSLQGHPALATQYESARGPIVILQALGEGQTVPNHPHAYAPLEYEPFKMETDAELICVTYNAAQALRIDPFNARWLMVGTDPEKYSLSVQGLQEIIVESIETPYPYQRGWPYAATLHGIPQAVISSRLGGQPGLIPVMARTAKVVEAWAASNWADDFQAPVDCDHSVHLASVASLLHALGEFPILAYLAESKVSRHGAGEAIAPELMAYGQLPECADPLPGVVYPATPPIAAAGDPPQEISKAALGREMGLAQYRIDFDYAPGVRHDPAIVDALKMGIQIGSDRLFRDSDMREHFRPRPNYYVREIPGAYIPSDVSLRFPDSEIDPEHRNVIAAAPDNRLNSGQKYMDFGTVAGCAAARGFPPYSSKDLPTYFVLTPTIGGALAGSRESYRDWTALHLNSDTQDAVFWVQSDSQWRVMPLRDDQPFTTGYNGTGPSNSNVAVVAFLEWVHGRKLTETERSIVKDRICRDKSPIVTIRRDLFLDL